MKHHHLRSACHGPAITLALTLAGGLFSPTLHLLAADRSEETNPNWHPPAVVRPDEAWPKRAYFGGTTVIPVTPAQVGNATNPARVARLLTERSRLTMPHGLHLFYGDRLPGIGYYALSPNPLGSSADGTARVLVEQALTGRSLNIDPRSLAYLAKAARAINEPSTTRRGEWAFGSEQFIRISGTWSLAGGVAAGDVADSCQARFVGTLFNRTRELALATLTSTASASPTGVKSSKITVKALGRPLVDEILTDRKPIVRSLSFSRGGAQTVWWGGAIFIPWLDASEAFRLRSDPVKVVARTAQGNAVGAGQVALRAHLELLGEIPLFDLFGFHQLVARIDCAPLDGQLIAGEAIGVMWISGDHPVLRDARHARAELSYGAVNLKVKVTSSFGPTAGPAWLGEKTCVNLLRHDGFSVQRDLFSAVSETPLR